MPEFKTAFSYTPALPLDLPLEDGAKQAFKDECDINNIVRRWQSTGVFESHNSKKPVYGDFSGIPSYHESLNAILKVEDSFHELSAEERARFDNDPANFFDYVVSRTSEKSAEEAGVSNKTSDLRETEASSADCEEASSSNLVEKATK